MIVTRTWLREQDGRYYTIACDSCRADIAHYDADDADGHLATEAIGIRLDDTEVPHDPGLTRHLCILCEGDRRCWKIGEAVDG